MTTDMVNNSSHYSQYKKQVIDSKMSDIKWNEYPEVIPPKSGKYFICAQCGSELYYYISNYNSDINIAPQDRFSADLVYAWMPIPNSINRVAEYEHREYFEDYQLSGIGIPECPKNFLRHKDNGFANSYEKQKRCL